MKKLIGILGVAGTAAVTIFHAVDPSQLPAKYAAGFAILSTLLALFGKHPLDKTD